MLIYWANKDFFFKTGLANGKPLSGIDLGTV